VAERNKFGCWGDFEPLKQCEEKYEYKGYWICLFDTHIDDDCIKRDYALVTKEGVCIYGPGSPYDGDYECERVVDHLNGGGTLETFDRHGHLKTEVSGPNTDKS